MAGSVVAAVGSGAAAVGVGVGWYAGAVGLGLVSWPVLMVGAGAGVVAGIGWAVKSAHKKK